MAVRLITIIKPIGQARLHVACLLLSSILLPAFGAAQCSLSCNPSVQVSLDLSGQVLITPQMIAPNSSASCPGTLEVKLYGPLGNLLPNPLTCASIGQDITATVRHIQSGNNCSGSLTVQDALPPMVSCPDKFIWCNQDPTPYETGFPLASDNCTPANALTMSWFDDETSFPCGVFHNGVPVAKRVDRTWVIEDASGNQKNCLQHVWLKQIAISNLSFPAHLDNIVLPALSCGQDPEDLNLTGQPMVDSLPVDISNICELAVTFADQTLNICPPGAYTIIRTWTAVDFCTSTVSNKLQIIKVQDIVPPTITAPANITVGTNGFLCTGSVLLPQALTSDNCSSVTTNPSWDYGSGFGPFNNIPEGEHIVIYTATDACGNTATTSMTVTVLDDSPPQAICPVSIQLSLSSGGSAILGASAIDGGSSDNCGPVNLSVSRDGDNFSPFIQLNCSDLGVPVPITLKVTDQVGLENFCITDVQVRDFLKPLLQCPANITINCLQDHNSLPLTGQASASDNCTLQSLDFIDVTNIAPCNTGSVSRTWKATDAAGNTKTCAQLITLIPINTVVVVFPPNITLSDCSGPTASLPAATGTPVITGQYCSPLSITYSDQIFTGTPPFCFRILRAWQVFDWCVYNPNGGSSGTWQYTQIIDIEDHTPPDLSIPFDVTLNADPADCQALANLSVAVGIDCSSSVSVTNNSIFALSPGVNASGYYPVGIHAVAFTATDACGNNVQHTLQITVKDITPPTVLCQTSISIQMQVGGMAILSPALLNAGSSDNCSPAANLVYKTSADTFTCQQIGSQQITLSVTDASGNSASCTTLVHVQDPLHVCNGDIMHTIQGNIRTTWGDTVRSIPMHLLADGFSEWKDCDTTGFFAFDDIPAGNLYHLKPYNNANWLNGLSTFDLVLISKHILGIQPLSSPYKMIAADANHSGSVTTTDILQLRKLILGIADSLTGNTSWRFVPVGFNFANPSNPFTSAFPEERLYPDLDSNYTAQDFVGFKVGDVNNSTDPANARSPLDTIPMYIGVNETDWQASSRIAVPVYLPAWAQLEGFQFEIAMDPALASIDRIEYANPDVFNESNISQRKDSLLAVSWNKALVTEPVGKSALLFTLFMSVKQTVNPVQAFHLSGERLMAEAYRDGDEPLLALALQFGDRAPEKTNTIVVFPGYPNPFADKTTIPFYLTAPDVVSLIVSDMLGRVVLEEKRPSPAGYQELSLNAKALPGAGLYLYRLFLPDGTGHTGTLVLTGR